MKLGVNIDHVATLREARYRGRGFGEPEPVHAALVCEKAGAHGITIHLREDRRHIQDRDCLAIRNAIQTRLNFEMNNQQSLVDFAIKELKPDIVCLVPEHRTEVTTEGGLDVIKQISALRDTCKRFAEAGIDVSLFIDPEQGQIDAASETGCQFIELHTGAFAEQFYDDNEATAELDLLISGAEQAHKNGLRVNAGHGLNYVNLPSIWQVPHLEELNIGHSIISRSVSVGLATAVQEMLELMKDYQGSNESA